jgi:drug/metabolite transporter (DMT)-like permease
MNQNVTTAPSSAVPLRAYGILLLGVISVAMAAIFIRLAQAENVPSLVIGSARLLIAAALLTPITLRRYRKHLRQLARADAILLLVSGTFLAIHFAGWVSSLEYTSVLVSGVLVTTTPIWVGILEVLILKMRLSRGFVIGLAIAISGGLLIALTGVESAARSDDPLLGGALSLLGAITVAVYLIIGRKLRPRLPLVPYIWSVYSIAALILGAVALVSGMTFTGYSTNAYLWLLALGIFPQLIGHSSFNYALAYLPATYISLATQVEPIGSALFAFLIFAEIPQPLQVVGSAVILIGVSIATLAPLRKS